MYTVCIIIIIYVHMHAYSIVTSYRRYLFIIKDNPAMAGLIYKTCMLAYLHKNFMEKSTPLFVS